METLLLTIISLVIVKLLANLSAENCPKANDDMLLQYHDDKLIYGYKT